jgi:hypothetical protein
MRMLVGIALVIAVVAFLALLVIDQRREKPRRRLNR